MEANIDIFTINKYKIFCPQSKNLKLELKLRRIIKTLHIVKVNIYKFILIKYMINT